MSQCFTKYEDRGPYHWREASRHPLHGWPYTRSRINWVVRQCEKSRTILEVGCGDAAILGRLAKAGKLVTGIESDKTAIDLARTIFSKNRLKGEFYSALSDVQGMQFDVVILAEVIEHLDDAHEYLAVIPNLLSDGGRLVLTTPIRLLEHPSDKHHVHEFWPGELRELLSQYFEDVRATRMHAAWLVDLMCFGIGGIRPVAVFANAVKLCTGIELLDRLPSPLSIYWTQGIVASLPRRTPGRSLQA